LDLIILEVFSNLGFYDFMILTFPLWERILSGWKWC